MTGLPTSGAATAWERAWATEREAKPRACEGDGEASAECRSRAVLEVIYLIRTRYRIVSSRAVGLGAASVRVRKRSVPSKNNTPSRLSYYPLALHTAV